MANTALTSFSPIHGLVRLGARLGRELASGAWITTGQQAEILNPWFTRENQRLALSEIASQLQEEVLMAWLAPYPGLPAATPRRVGLILAGNLPLVGWADILAVLAAGHVAVIKLSSQDQVLPRYLQALLIEEAPELAIRWQEIDRLPEVDAVIATGSNNSARYFEAYFGKYPHIIRRNRNALALLDGQETAQDLEALGQDIFAYFGLGCRSVACMLVPKGWEVGKLVPALTPYAHLADHNKYANNLEYHRAIFLMNLDKFYDMGGLLIREVDSLHSPLAVLNIIYYNSPTQAQAWIEDHQGHIQCLVSREAHWPGSLPLGQAQHPTLTDYADGIDTLAFLQGLSR